jgi:nucleoside-diphosphate-sugar epimerase
MKSTLIFGATGGIGSQVLTRLLEGGTPCIVIVRSEARLPQAYRSGHSLLTTVVTPDGHLAMNDAELDDHLRRCDAVVSCVGHNISCAGIFGSASKDLCVNTTRRVCEAIQRLQSPVKYIVVSTEGVSRPDGLDPKLRGLLERLVLWLLEVLLPPHADNVKNAAYLHCEVGRGNNGLVEFCAVRPSDLVDGEETRYALHEVLQNGIFNAGKTTRANVGSFMADLVTKPSIWAQWKGKWPHILDAP